MPTLETRDGDLRAIGNLLDEQSQDERIGWHISELIRIRRLVSRGRSIQQAHNAVYEEPRDFRPDWMEAHAAIGQIWEYTCIKHFVETLGAHGKTWYILDQIHGTLDGRWYPDGVPTVLECKYRHGDPSEDPTKETKDWMPRGMGYCKMIGGVHIVMPILYIPGDHKRAGYKLHRITFTQEDIDSNWASLVAIRESLEEAGFHAPGTLAEC